MILISLAVILLSIASQSSGKHVTGSHASNLLVIDEYSSDFDLTSQNPIEKIAIKVTNKSPEPISKITFLVPDDRIVIGSSVEDSYGQPLEFVNTNTTVDVAIDEKKQLKFKVFNIILSNPLSPEYDIKISKIILHYNSFYVFRPRSVTLFDDQKVRVQAYKVPASPYKIEKVEYKVKYGDARTPTRDEQTVRNPVEPFSPVATTLHFVLNTHFVHSRKTTRYIEISHWGNIFFKDEYYLHNRGAKLRGAFSTIDYNKGRKDTGKNSYRAENIKLPVNAWGFYYRDEIGNISTTTVTRTVSDWN